MQAASKSQVLLDDPDVWPADRCGGNSGSGAATAISFARPFARTDPSLQCNQLNPVARLEPVGLWVAVMAVQKSTVQ